MKLPALLLVLMLAVPALSHDGEHPAPVADPAANAVTDSPVCGQATVLEDRISRLEAALGLADEAVAEIPPGVLSFSIEDDEPQQFGGRRLDRAETRRLILEVAETELSRMQMIKLRFAMAVRPVKTQAAIDMIQVRCQVEGMTDADGEIAEAADWAAILAIIMELLPLILKLFGL